MRKPDFCLCLQISFAVTAKLISAFVFATRIVQFLFYLNPKFQASSSFLSLYRPVCVGPGRKPRSPVFSRRGSNASKHVICMSRLYFSRNRFELEKFYNIGAIFCTFRHRNCCVKIGPQYWTNLVW